MEIQKIKIKGDYKLADIIHDVEKGILRIPQFQREFVWDKSRVIKLLESIYNEYPIGSFFFWDAPQHYHNFYRDIADLNLPKPDKYDKIIFILDGQQRITSLYVTVKGLQLYGRNYREICFDLDEKAFVDRETDEERYVSVVDLLSDEKPDIYDKLTPERKLAYKDCYRRFVNYPFSAIDVREKELDEVCDIFERINQGGQKLNLFDLISAGTWTPDFDLRTEVKKENVRLKTEGFGEIDNEIFIQALALISHGSCIRVIQLQLRSEDVKRYWRETILNIGLAIDYLRGSLGVVNSLFIPYRSTIALIAYLFYKIKSRSLDNKQTELLNLWFWRSAFSERYGASTLTTMTEDRKLMDKIASGNDIAIKFPVSLDIDSLIKIRMTKHSAIKNGVLCLLARNNPRHFKNNSPLSLKDDYFSDFNNSEIHHIFPKSIVQKNFSIAMVHSLPNFCFIQAELNKEISNKKPSVYFEEYAKYNPDFERTLKTHLIKYDEAIKKDDYLSFLGARAVFLLDEINKLIGGKKSPLDLDEANEATDKTEKKLRELIDRKMKNKDLNYWGKYIPPDVVAETRKKVESYLTKDPSKTINDFNSRVNLDFCDIMDYLKIILTNWDIFNSAFRSKSESEKKFLNWKEYRNIIKHGRGEMVSFIQKEGEAAIEWLEIILNSENEKKKQFSAAISTKNLNETQMARRKFWEGLLSLEKKRNGPFSKISPTIYHWIGVSTGRKGLIFVYSIYQNFGSIELYIDSGKESGEINKNRFDELFNYKKEIERLFGDELEWKRMDNYRACRIAKRYQEFGLNNEGKWEELQKKMVEGMISLEKALKKYIEKL